MIEYKICSKCDDKKEENDSNFRLYVYPSGKTYFKSFCRNCKKQSSRNYVQNHREEKKAYQRNFTIKHPEYKKNYKIVNKDKINEKERLRRKNDINFKLKKNVSRSIGHALDRVFSDKNGSSTIKYLPYTLTELKERLEKQFDNNMSWDNYGTYWHIDHIVPHSEFKYISMEDMVFQECWALSNLRPLEANQNRLDGATRVRHKND